MADPKSRRTGELNKDLIELRAEAAAMRAKLVALEERVAVLERELVSAKAGRPSTPPGKKIAGPPPLPRIPGLTSMPPKSSGRRSVVDISEIAELVDSMPPPPSRRPPK